MKVVEEDKPPHLQFFSTYVFRPRGYKTFFMLNSTEHEISTGHKNLNTDKEVSCFKSLRVYLSCL